MLDRALIRTGTVGAIFAAICCATPVLAVLLPAVGRGARLGRADLFVFPLLFACLGLAASGHYSRHATACAYCETKVPKEGLNS